MGAVFMLLGGVVLFLLGGAANEAVERDDFTHLEELRGLVVSMGFAFILIGGLLTAVGIVNLYNQI